MRSLTRLLLVTIALSVVAALVLVSFLDSENVVRFNEAISENHWKFTSLRVIVFTLLLGGMYGFRHWKSTRTSESDTSKLRAQSHVQLIRIVMWLLIVELFLGQGLVNRIIELATQ